MCTMDLELLLPRVCSGTNTFNLYFDTVIHMSLGSHQVQNKGVGIAYLHNAKLVGNRRKLQLETLVTDLEHAEDMALLLTLGMT